jgi:hypothetical protein
MCVRPTCITKLINLDTDAVLFLLASRLLRGRSCMADDQDRERLKDCLATVQNLTEENKQLRRAAASFGQLAERLNEALASERRVPGRDRRREPRDGSERRTQTQRG